VLNRVPQIPVPARPVRVKLAISDAHAGLRSAISTVMLGAGWQRCRIHFARTLLARVHKGHGEMVAAVFRTVFAQTSAHEVHIQLEAVAGVLEHQFPQAAGLLREVGPDITAFTEFPHAHGKRIGSANPLERLNREIKRRPTSWACSLTPKPSHA
jgi:putative transposase